MRDSIDERRALVALSLIPGLGPGRIGKLVSRIGSASEVLRTPMAMLAGIPGIGLKIAQSIIAFSGQDEVDAQFRSARRVGARLVTETDSDYPSLLREIYDPPAFLWMRGEFHQCDNLAIAVVGTRRATAYGRHVAAKLAEGLAARGVTVVSGLAYGIDTSAHRGALDGGGRTIGVLGSGIDRVYPSSNRGLARRIMERGCLLSEYALGAAPDAPNFPRRNRIISGMTLGTVVVEAFEEGGAHITARLACEQNREVFAVPSPISRPDGPGSGCNRLIQRGHAKLIMSVDDILAEFPRINILPPADSDQNEPPQSLCSEELLLLEAIENQPIHLDAICSKCELDPSTALVHLLSLEFKGFVRQMAGKQFVRN